MNLRWEARSDGMIRIIEGWDHSPGRTIYLERDESDIFTRLVTRNPASADLICHAFFEPIATEQARVAREKQRENEERTREIRSPRPYRRRYG